MSKPPSPWRPSTEYLEKPVRRERHHSQSSCSARSWEVPTDCILPSESIESQYQDFCVAAIPLADFSIQGPAKSVK